MAFTFCDETGLNSLPLLGDLALPLTTRQVDELKPVFAVMARARSSDAISLEQVLRTPSKQVLDNAHYHHLMHFAQGSG